MESTERKPFTSLRKTHNHYYSNNTTIITTTTTTTAASATTTTTTNTTANFTTIKITVTAAATLTTTTSTTTTAITTTSNNSHNIFAVCLPFRWKAETMCDVPAVSAAELAASRGTVARRSPAAERCTGRTLLSCRAQGLGARCRSSAAWTCHTNRRN